MKLLQSYPSAQHSCFFASKKKKVVLALYSNIIKTRHNSENNMKGFDQALMSAGFMGDSHTPLGYVMKLNETTLRSKMIIDVPIFVPKLKVC